MTFPNRYPAGMSFWKIRRVLALVVAVVLAAGLVTHGFGGPDMVVTSAVTAAHDMPMAARAMRGASHRQRVLLFVAP
jgi:hypothetical protein